MDLTTALDYAAKHRSGIVITLRKDGRAQSSDIAYGVADGTIRISATHDRAKVHNIRRDPRVVLHVSNPAGYSYLSFDGTATVSDVATAPDDAVVEELIDAYRAVAGKEHPDWHEFRQAMVDEKRVVVTITPTSVVGMLNG